MSPHSTSLLTASMLVIANLVSAPAATIITPTNLGGGVLRYEINLNGTGNTPASGDWDSAPLTDSAGNAVSSLTVTTNPAPIVLQNSSSGYSLNFVGTFGFWLGGNNPAQPITSSAWYYGLGVNPTAPTFSIQGLSAGDKVSLWATYGWDGATKAPQINFNGAGLVNLNTAVAAIGTNPGPSDLVSVATNVVATGSSLSGVLDFPSSLNGEGQLGALIIDIQSIPEPSVVALFALGMVFALSRVFTTLLDQRSRLIAILRLTRIRDNESAFPVLPTPNRERVRSFCHTPPFILQVR